MVPATDWRIYQRNSEGYAEVLAAGTLPDFAPENPIVQTRVCCEEDNLTIVPWTVAEVEGNQWHITLKLPQGGLYRIETCAADSMLAPDWQPRIQNIQHVGVGELFMITGQSNMAGYGRDNAFDPPQMGVHLFGNNGKWQLAAHPLNDSIDTIYPENCERATGTSPLLAFARKVQKALNVPVGLVQASLGGSPLSAWHEEEDGVLTRAMYRRLEATGPVGGVVWYQGCSDTDFPERANSYLTRFKRMVELWRERMGAVSVITVQLNRWEGQPGMPLERERSWGKVREAQRQAANVIPDLCVVSATDLGTTDGIHNSSGGNVILGERLALTYLKSHWGLPGMTAPSVTKVVRVDDTHLKAYFCEGCRIKVISAHDSGIEAEDDLGLTPCVRAGLEDNALLLEFGRAFEGEVRLHAGWRANPGVYLPRELHGMPMLSCYGVKAE